MQNIRNPNDHNLRDIKQSLGPRRAHPTYPPSLPALQPQSPDNGGPTAPPPQQYTVVNTHTVSINGANVYSSGGGLSAMTGSNAVTQPLKLRPDRKEALNQIKQSLLPFDNSFNSGVSSASSAANCAYDSYCSNANGLVNSPSTSATNTDTLSSESSSGSADVNYLQEYAMLECLVSMGFDRDAAFYALKLTQFRHIQHAVEILLKTNSSHVYGRNLVQRKTSFETADGSSSRSESPMTLQQQPMAIGHAPLQSHQSPSAAPPHQRVAANAKLTNGGGPAQLCPTPSTQPYAQRTPSPMTHNAGLNDYPKMYNDCRRCHVTVGGPSDQSHASDGKIPFAVRQTVLPVIQHTAMSKKVERPVAQCAEQPSAFAFGDRTPTATSVAPPIASTSTIFVGGSRVAVALPATSAATAVQTPPSDPRYLEHLFQRVNNVLTVRSGGGQHVMTGPNGLLFCKRDSAASSSSDNSAGGVAASATNHSATPPTAIGGSKASAQSSSKSASQHNLVFAATTKSAAAQSRHLAEFADHRRLARNQPINVAAQKPVKSVGQSTTERASDHWTAANRGAARFDAIDQPASRFDEFNQSATRPGEFNQSAARLGEFNQSASRYDEFNPSATRLDGFSQSASGVDEFSQSARCRGVVYDQPACSNAKECANACAVQRIVSPVPDTARRLFKNLNSSDSGNEPKFSFKPCTPQAFKFFMEQHVENVIKQHKQRQRRALELEKEMQKANFSPQIQCHMRNLLKHKESQYLRLKRQKMDASLFKKIQTIGVGAFGEVTLVMKKDTKTLFAMKTLRKSDVIKKNQAAHVKAERDVLSEADNEWVVKLYYSFQDRDNLFFIMEYIPGGDMMALLIKKGIFEEDLARFYIAELVCAIESVHKLKFIHRDIKPDNILIDQNGHIKLTDFGLCTGLRWTHDWKRYADLPAASGHSHQDSFDLLQMREPSGEHKILDFRQQRPRRKAHSLVGTPNYIAPEVLLRIGHTQLCDFWSVGVILYEMVVGHPPFLANSPEETQLKVVHWRETLSIPKESQLSPQCEDLILSLCRGHEDRLGRLPGAADIRQHAFFKDIDWENLRRMRAPYKPEILHATDTSNFDPVEPRSLDDVSESVAMATETGTVADQSATAPGLPDHAFYEFTFRRFFNSDGHGCPTLVDPLSNPRSRLEPVFEPDDQPDGSEPDPVTGSGSADRMRVRTVNEPEGYAISTNRSPHWHSNAGASNISVLRVNAEEAEPTGVVRLDENYDDDSRLVGYGRSNFRLDGYGNGTNDCDSYYRVQERYGYYDRSKRHAGVYDSSSTATGGTLIDQSAIDYSNPNRLSYGSVGTTDSEPYNTDPQQPNRSGVGSTDSSVYV